LKRLLTPLIDALSHIRNALLNPKHVASPFPSSRFVAGAVVRRLPPGTRSVLEYGAGTGAITRPLLESLPKDGKLISFELSTEFEKNLRKIADPRLDVRYGAVLDLLPHVASDFPEGADAIVSGIPFSLISEAHKEEIFKATFKALRPGGRFIVYQSSRLLVPTFKKYFKDVTVHYEIRNIFPYFVIDGLR
jgi:phosphatidylethanolamine/phosphatidyl-N-methylethanolamine N-methyltransferase